MMTEDKLLRLAEQFHKGVINAAELYNEIIEVVQQDRSEILEAERNGTLVTYSGEEV